MASHSLVTFPDSLQYADGDVIIQTSANPSGILVVHSNVLAEGSDYFRALFKGRDWSKTTTVHNADGSKMTVWHLQMFFDRDSKLCLLTDQPDRINEDRDIDFPYLELNEEDGIEVPPWSEIRKWKMSINNARAEQPRKTFLWHQEQPQSYTPVFWHNRQHPPHPNTLSATCFGVGESTYAPYLEASEDMMSSTNDFRTHDNYWRIPRHEETRRLAEKVWKAFVTLLYGKDIVLSSTAYFPDIAKFIATIVTYANYYGALDTISPRIERLLLRLPLLWQKVSEEPTYFTLLGYWIRSTRIFIDGVKHLVGRGLGGSFALHNESLRGPVFTQWPAEVSAVVHMAEEHLREEFGKFRHKIVIFTRQDLDWRYYPDELSCTERYRYIDVARLAISDYLSEYAPDRQCDITGIPSPSCTIFIRRLQEELSTTAGIEELSDGLVRVVRTHTVDPTCIKPYIDYGLQIVAEAFDQSPLFGHNHHCCEEMLPAAKLWAADSWSQKEYRCCKECGSEGHLECRRCLTAEHEAPDHLTFLPHCTGWTDNTPWRGGWQYRELNKTHETKPVGGQHLRDIGLGWCAFVSNIERRKSSRLETDTLLDTQSETFQALFNDEQEEMLETPDRSSS